MSKLKARAFSAVKLEAEAQTKARAVADGELVGRLVDSSQADDRKMIRLVRERRLLYARNNMPVASYHSQVKTLWQEVAREMGWTVADVRRKWSHIRNSYSRHLRNELHGAITAKGRSVSRWYLADELAFLREHMATDTRSSPYSTSFAPSFLELDMGEAAEPSLLASPWLLPPDDSSSSAAEPDDSAAYFHFFRGLHPDYLELTPRRQRCFKRHCLAFLHRLLDEQDAPGRGAGRGEGGDAEEPDAVNLAGSHASDDEDCKMCVLSGVSGAGGGAAD